LYIKIAAKIYCVHTQLSVRFLGEKARFRRTSWRLDYSNHIGKINIVAS